MPMTILRMFQVNTAPYFLSYDEEKKSTIVTDGMSDKILFRMDSAMMLYDHKERLVGYAISGTDGSWIFDDLATGAHFRTECTSKDRAMTMFCRYLLAK